MLKSLSCKNFTVFKDSGFEFSPNLNVIIGENGSGKSHLLKLLYSIIYAPILNNRMIQDKDVHKGKYDYALFVTLSKVFNSNNFWELSSGTRAENIDINASFEDESKNIGCSYRKIPDENSVFSQNTFTSEMLEEIEPVSIPPNELLSYSSWFPAIAEKFNIPVSSFIADTAKKLNLPEINKVELDSFIKILEDSIGGKIELNENTFYCSYNDIPERKIISHMMADGHKKLGTIIELIKRGAIRPGSQLFWDEPEANLNPKLVKGIAKIIIELSKHNIQIFIATHSTFLLKEIQYLLSTSSKDCRVKFISLKKSGAQTVCECKDSIDSVKNILSLEEEFEQSSRIIEAHNGF